MLLNRLRFFILSVILLSKMMLGLPSLFAQDTLVLDNQNVDTFNDYIEKVYEISYENVYGLRKIKGTLNGYPLTAIFDEENVGVSLTSFNASNMLEKGMIEESEVYVSGKLFDGKIVPSGAVVILKSITFGDFRRNNVKAKVVDNCNPAFSVGDKLFVGDSAICKKVTIDKKIIRIRFFERIIN